MNDCKYFIEKAYQTIDPSSGLLSLEDTLQVISLYFSSYEKHTGRSHPHLKQSQLCNIIEQLDYCEDEKSGRGENFSIYEYEIAIPAHFKTRYRAGCDYNINHFFTGCIRLLRLLEKHDGED